MGQSAIMLIAFGVLIIIFAVVYIVTSLKSINKKTNDNTPEKKDSKNIEKESLKTGIKPTEHSIPRNDMSSFMQFDKISDDMIVQKKGTKYTMIIQCKGINYDLMSEVEQMGIEEGFITFLNTLKKPIQLYVKQDR